MNGLFRRLGAKLNILVFAELRCLLATPAIPAKANPDPNMVKNASFAITGGSSSSG